MQLANAASRVVSSEISGGKFPEDSGNLFNFFFRNFRKLLITYISQLFLTTALQSDAVKEACS